MSDSKLGFEILSVFGDLGELSVIKFSLRRVKWSNELKARIIFEDGSWTSKEDEERFDPFIPLGMAFEKIELSYDF